MTDPAAAVAVVLRKPWVSRVGSAGLAGAIGFVFTLSALLEPSREGHGTHLQLGLGQCSFLALSGQPCPMCGATTTFTLLAHLRPVDAFLNQPFATLLFGLAAAALGVAVAEVIDPRQRWTRIADRLERWEGLLAVLFLAAMGVSWIYKAALMGGWLG